MTDPADPPRYATAAPCSVHNRHAPASHVNEVHHVWPLGQNGPDVPANKIVVCATGHNSIHQLLSAYLKAAGDPGWDVRRQYTVGERELALLGYQRIARGSL